MTRVAGPILSTAFLATAIAERNQVGFLASVLALYLSLSSALRSPSSVFRSHGKAHFDHS
jgi:hypothetical protein